MHKDFLVSIVLVNYNGMKDTVDCINSLLNIRYGNYVIIVVDNGSTDKEDLPSDYLSNNKIVYLKNEDNLGFAGGNNIGCRYAIEELHVDYLLLLNNDTIVDCSFLNHMMSCIEKYGSETVVTGKILYESDHTKLWYAGGRIDYSRGLAVHFTDEKWSSKKRYPKVSFASGCLLLLSSKAFSEIEGIPEEYFLYYEDADLCSILREKGYVIRYCSDAVIYHKVNASTGTKSNLSIYYGSRNRLYFIKKFGKRKIKGYLSAYAMCLRSVLKHPSRIKVVKQAIEDFHMCKMGRTEMKFE